YFYPYPQAGIDFPDDATYAAHGGGLSLGDWRRQNVNQMVAAVMTLVRDIRPEVRFGIAPFGIYRPGMPEGITGLDQWAQLFADPLAWMETGDVDYIAPQLYWPTTQAGQEYGLLLDWWAVEALANGRDFYIGNYLSKLGTTSAWSRAEIEEQLRLAREDPRVLGTIQYQIEPLVEDRDSITSYFAVHNATPASTPPIPDADEVPDPPVVTVAGAQVTLSGAGRYYAVYLDEEGSWVISRLVHGDQATLYRGRWAISVVGRNGLESLGVVVAIEEGEPPTGDPCTHSYGGVYVNGGCSASYQCCDGVWEAGTDVCGACVCVEATGTIGCE
ncbi:family 10 glycosylhydrolase, partial [Myxococcota bacterium]|nr:family 10 glycosylhydrolase [Myxococcota bacterium]MBU1534811.1 family 10 glycosylhydrolase [Myxococcota bacterium]